ncbi:hypothetical protein [Paracoccus sp. PAR01]|uniref:hypothetical protein n=1 Tax=Paracoccus sp. PAR01 TaxID=2769282 RepID=UPI001781BCB2|nr:hypothetical protein [Paracoccus sp. PAR01]MBD9529600.1 hypothetical protein [Paracoccus sp. PAR01]
MTQTRPNLLQRLRDDLAPAATEPLRAEIIARAAEAAEKRRMQDDVAGLMPATMMPGRKRDDEALPPARSTSDSVQSQLSVPSPLHLPGERPSLATERLTQADTTCSSAAPEKRTVEILEKRMARADWHYAYADDPDTRSSGRTEISALTRDAGRLAAASVEAAVQVSEIWDRVIPQDYRMTFEGYVGRRHQPSDQADLHREERDKPGDRER